MSKKVLKSQLQTTQHHNIIIIELTSHGQQREQNDASLQPPAARSDGPHRRYENGRRGLLPTAVDGGAPERRDGTTARRRARPHVVGRRASSRSTNEELRRHGSMMRGRPLYIVLDAISSVECQYQSLNAISGRSRDPHQGKEPTCNDQRATKTRERVVADLYDAVEIHECITARNGIPLYFALDCELPIARHNSPLLCSSRCASGLPTLSLWLDVVLVRGTDRIAYATLATTRECITARNNMPLLRTLLCTLIARHDSPLLCISRCASGLPALSLYVVRCRPRSRHASRTRRSPSFATRIADATLATTRDLAWPTLTSIVCGDDSIGRRVVRVGAGNAARLVGGRAFPSQRPGTAAVPDGGPGP